MQEDGPSDNLKFLIKVDCVMAGDSSVKMYIKRFLYGTTYFTDVKEKCRYWLKTLFSLHANGIPV